MCRIKINRLPLTHPQLGTWPTTQAHALARNQTWDLSIHRLASAQSTEPHQQGLFIDLFFRKRGREGERKGGKHQCKRKTLIGCLLHTPHLETQPQTQASALTGNQTSDLSL